METNNHRRRIVWGDTALITILLLFLPSTLLSQQSWRNLVLDEVTSDCLDIGWLRPHGPPQRIDEERSFVFVIPPGATQPVYATFLTAMASGEEFDGGWLLADFPEKVFVVECSLRIGGRTSHYEYIVGVAESHFERDRLLIGAVVASQYH
jgi:hypothetical protein